VAQIGHEESPNMKKSASIVTLLATMVILVLAVYALDVASILIAVVVTGLIFVGSMHVQSTSLELS
jgi:hypothetical protein